MIGLFDIMDESISDQLGVDVKTYIKIIDGRCTEEEANFIIMTILDGDSENMEKAKETFMKYLDE
jgi:hypothetical protein